MLSKEMTEGVEVVGAANTCSLSSLDSCTLTLASCSAILWSEERHRRS
jgi:hypothetical protein